MIRSHQNPRVKAAVKLRNARSRRAEGKFLIDGLTELKRAVASGIALETVFFHGEATHSELRSLPIAATCLWEVSAEILDRLNYGQRENAVVAIGITPQTTCKELPIRSDSLLLALDQTEKPGNLGACLRTAAACGVDAVLLVNPICELFNPNTIRASRGAVFSLPIAAITAQELEVLRSQHGLKLVGARVDAKRSLWECDLRQGSILLFGNEAHGLGPEWIPRTDMDFTIPMRGEPDSLNLSISAAVTLYEAVRQRSLPNI